MGGSFPSCLIAASASRGLAMQRRICLLPGRSRCSFARLAGYFLEGAWRYQVLREQSRGVRNGMLNRRKNETLLARRKVEAAYVTIRGATVGGGSRAVALSG